MTPKRLLVMSLLLAPLTLPPSAQAADLDFAGKLAEARNCLGFLGSLRDTDSFREMALDGLMREVARNIDYAETWAPHDLPRAASYLAADCDSAVIAWAEIRDRRVASAIANADSAATGPDDAASPATNGARDHLRVLQVMSGTGAVRRPVIVQQTAAWQSLDTRRSHPITESHR